MALQRTGVCHGREEIRSLLYSNDWGDRGSFDGSAGVKDDKKLRSVAVLLVQRPGLRPARFKEQDQEKICHSDSSNAARLLRFIGRVWRSRWPGCGGGCGPG